MAHNAVAIATSLSLDDIDGAPATDKKGHPHSPVLKLKADARSKGYQTVVLPLTTNKWRERWTETCLLPEGQLESIDAMADYRAEMWRSQPAFLPGEVTMNGLDEAEGVVVMISDWLELDAEDDWVRDDYQTALQQELSYAAYLNIHAAILPPPRNRSHVASYARAIKACLRNTSYLQLSIRLPIYDPPELNAASATASSPKSHKRNSTRMASMLSPTSMMLAPRIVIPERDERFRPGVKGELSATWEMWDVIRTICDYSPRLTLTLDLSLPLPSALGVLSKWSAESVRYIFLPATTFIANAKGYPVLPKGTQAFIKDNVRHRPTVILSDVRKGLHKMGEERYAQYVRYLEESSEAVVNSQKPGTVENFAQGYQDYLQAPLQPLMDNLQSITYQTFEQDPVKYRHYEEAIYLALLDRPPTDRLVICIAGAGRGPLIARCLSATQRARRNVVIYAVEKNPNAWVTLQNRKEVEWASKNVTLLFGDMRSIDIPELADILVSELLGSFGDNELSPECLDGAVRFLKADGISIPSSYTAYLAPLSSSKLYDEARGGNNSEKGLETPYVVMFQAVNILSDDGPGVGACGVQVQECWEFEHPRKNPALDARGLPITNSHNTRSAKLRFHIPHTGVLHGLAGYFEAILYGSIGLSIHPHRKDQISPDMLSWFPLFFPFREPVYLPSDSELEVSIWRLTNQRQVWYEWYAEVFLPIGPPAPPSPVFSIYSPPKKPAGLAFVFPAPAIPAAPPSPLVDAIDSPMMDLEKGSPRVREDRPGAAESEIIVKIAQTALHNPGGRSSWIGL